MVLKYSFYVQGLFYIHYLVFYSYIIKQLIYFLLIRNWSYFITNKNLIKNAILKNYFVITVIYHSFTD